MPSAAARSVPGVSAAWSHGISMIAGLEYVHLEIRKLAELFLRTGHGIGVTRQINVADRRVQIAVIALQCTVAAATGAVRRRRLRCRRSCVHLDGNRAIAGHDGKCRVRRHLRPTERSSRRPGKTSRKCA